MASTTSHPIAFVTGANQGIGLAVTNILAIKHRYHVIVGSRNLDAGKKVASDLRSAGHAASAIQLDLSSESSINAAVRTIEHDFGHLDVLINNAGILLDTKESSRKLSTFELFNQTFTTNVIGTAALTDGLVPLLRKAVARPARIVFVSSIMGSLQMSTDKTTLYYNIDYKAYDASKAALNMLMINYTRNLNGTGVKVNAVCPGYVKSSLTEFNEHAMSPEVGAEHVVKMATVGEDGPTGTFSNRDGIVPW